jgi:hypothetical protein
MNGEGLQRLVPLIVALGGASLLGANAEQTEDAMGEAELMNEALREFEAARMGQTINNLSAKTASVCGAALAKEAFIGGLVGGLGRAAGGALGGVGKAMTGLGRSSPTFRFQQSARSLGVAPAVAPGGVSNTLRAGGAQLRQAGNTLSRGATTFQQNAVLGKPGGKPLLGGLSKGKILGGAALVGTGYMGLKGMQATRDFMMQPAHTPVYGQGAPGLRHGVTEYGY